MHRLTEISTFSSSDSILPDVSCQPIFALLSTKSGRKIGNTPQVFSRFACVNAATHLEEICFIPFGRIFE
ncbi:hypothetical protein BO71DRAFT_228336 [Aspergillus ellipticus CBS 707.79]|uniref:Uncharacterized protein n=1 Tax=Aspergillus ellipticus CBS 707.79 TaxID=1448320 RepID=A0A319DAS7_9EURO|nr:hypothetical protein BO71DRAFT_228336 [Aspergillus ellipticus CBS 707.79]